MFRTLPAVLKLLEKLVVNAVECIFLPELPVSHKPNMKTPNYQAVVQYRRALHAVIYMAQYEAELKVKICKQYQQEIGNLLAHQEDSPDLEERHELESKFLDEYGVTPDIYRVLDLINSKYKLVAVGEGVRIVGAQEYDTPDIDIVSEAKAILEEVQILDARIKKNHQLDAELN